MTTRSTTFPRWAQATVDNPVAFFYLFRFFTWLLAVIIYLTQSAPEVNLRYGLGLALYTLLHLVVGTAYAVIVHPRLASQQQGYATLHPLRHVLSVGSLDIIASLFVVYFSGGWGSPYWHFAVTSILVPCFLVTFRSAMIITTAFVGIYVVTLIRGGDGLDGLWLTSQLHLFIGFIFTAYLVGMSVSYLGHVFRALDTQRLRTRAALDDLETLFDVAGNVISATDNEQELLQHITQTMRERRQYDIFALYTWDDSENVLKLSSATVGLEELEDGPIVEPGQGLMGKAAESRLAQIDATSQPGRAAIPIKGDNKLLGGLLLASSEFTYDTSRAVSLAEALANQIAIGIQNARLQKQQLDLAAQEERNRIAREIHDGVAQSMYALNLNLETCVELAEREKGPLRERLRSLVPLAKQTLMETRHYIYDLKPLLSGETSLAAVVENQVKEFQTISGIPVNLSMKGESENIPVGIGTGFYRILQEIFGNILKHSHASEVIVEVTFKPDSVILQVRDNGVGFDEDALTPGYGLQNMRQRTEELGGTFEITSSRNAGASIKASLPIQEVAREFD